MICRCAVLALVCIVPLIAHGQDKPKRGSAVNSNGAVIGKDEGTSPYHDQYRIALQHVANGDIAAAERIYEDLVQLEPDSPNPLVGWAGCRMQQGDYDGARRLYGNALQVKPDSVNALVGLGATYLVESKHDAALRYYRKAADLDTGSSEAHWGLAVIYANRGEAERARGHVFRYKRLVPDSPRIEDLERAVEKAIAESEGEAPKQERGE